MSAQSTSSITLVKSKTILNFVCLIFTSFTINFLAVKTLISVKILVHPFYFSDVTSKSYEKKSYLISEKTPYFSPRRRLGWADINSAGIHHALDLQSYSVRFISC